MKIHYNSPRKSKSQGENSRNEGVSPKMIEEEAENRE